MRLIHILLGAIAFACDSMTLATADEILLKDGKKIVWKSIIDEGDEYVVETPSGTKSRVKKSDIEKMVLSAADPALALTGASFTFDKKKTVMVDLLVKADPAGPGVTGTWKKQGAVLTGSASGFTHGKIWVDHPVPAEYDLAIVAERRDSLNGFYIGLLVDEKPLVLHFDSVEGTVVGLDVTEEKSARLPGPVFKNNTPRTIKVMVRKEAVIVQLDGKDLLGWKVDMRRSAPNAALLIPQKDRLWFGIYGSTWKISSAVLTYAR